MLKCADSAFDYKSSVSLQAQTTYAIDSSLRRKQSTRFTKTQVIVLVHHPFLGGEIDNQVTEVVKGWRPAQPPDTN